MIKSKVRICIQCGIPLAMQEDVKKNHKNCEICRADFGRDEYYHRKISKAIYPDDEYPEEDSIKYDESKRYRELSFDV